MDMQHEQGGPMLGGWICGREEDRQGMVGQPHHELADGDIFRLHYRTNNAVFSLVTMTLVYDP